MLYAKDLVLMSSNSALSLQEEIHGIGKIAQCYFCWMSIYLFISDKGAAYLCPLLRVKTCTFLFTSNKSVNITSQLLADKGALHELSIFTK